MYAQHIVVKGEMLLMPDEPDDYMDSNGNQGRFSRDVTSEISGSGMIGQFACVCVNNGSIISIRSLC